MEWPVALLVILGGLVLLLGTGLPVAFCFLIINLVGAYLWWGGETGAQFLMTSMYDSLSKFVFLPIPMFVLMGEVMFRSGMAWRMVDVIDRWLGHLPGRVALLAVASGTLFGTLTGTSMASTAMLGTVLLPQMLKKGYKKPMSLGPILGSGGLAMIIPPSGMAVLLAALGEFSVGKLLIAGIIPGLLMASLYAGYIIIRCWLQPSVAPSFQVTSTPLLERMILTAKYVLPLGFIVFVVLGFIFLGIATPSEAAAMGALASLILSAFYRRLNWEMLKTSVSGTLRITVMVFMILCGANAFSQILAFSGASTGLIGLVVELDLAPIFLLIVMQGALLVLGTFMSATAIIMIAVPIYMPIIYTLGIDPVWFGLITLLNLEMATTSPPFGANLFVMKAVAPPDTTIGDCYRGALPFLGCDMIAMALIIGLPILALWLPSVM